MWEAIDGIIVINLVHRRDRLKSIAERMRNLGIPADRVYLIRARWRPELPKLGKGESHYLAIKKAIELGWRRYIICQDDAVLSNSHQHWAELFKWSIENTWKVINLGYIVNSDYCEPISTLELGRIYQTSDILGTTCYMVSGDYSSSLLKNIEEGLQFYDSLQLPDYVIDEYWMNEQMQGGWYIYAPRLVRQENGYSDIRRAIVDYTGYYRRPIRVLDTTGEMHSDTIEPIGELLPNNPSIINNNESDN